MKWPLTLVALAFLLGLLTWLSLRALNEDAEIFDGALATLNRFSMTENGLQRDVLSARAGILRNYDPLVRETNALDNLLNRLRDITKPDAEISAALDRLAASMAGQEALVERFKSNNAQLQNSLAYFELITAHLGGSEQTGPATSALAAAMLHLTLDTSSTTVRQVEDRLSDLAKVPRPLSDAEFIQPLLEHGRLLNELLPATDRILKALFAAPLKGDEEAVRAVILTRQGASRATARQFRLTLYVTSLLLVGLLLYFGLQLRARALAARRRAALERAITAISMRFVKADPEDIDADIDQALAELGECVGADRVYFSLSGPPARTHLWCRQGTPFPPDWPRQASGLAVRFSPGIEGVVHVPDASRLRCEEDRNVCGTFGLRGWACVAGADAEGGDVVLGFDAVRQPCRITRSGELGLLRMACDMLVNTVLRQVTAQERTRLAARLQQARRMETVGALTSGIAHNFNNIVGAILGYAEMAETHVRSGQPARHLNEIRRAGERARDLVDQILAFGRRRDARRKPVSARTVLAEAASLLHASLPRGIDLVIREAPAAAVVAGESVQLQQVILNLCNNAAQAMNGNGRIEIETRVHDIARARTLSHGHLARGRYVCVAVSDTGRGIDEAVLERIFEPFFTTRLTGNGLGLATVREIVRDHGGAMNVFSTPGVGSRFEAWLASITEVESSPRREAPALPLGRGETLLVVNGHRGPLLRDEEILAALGYEPVGFTVSGDALAACRMAPKRFDALVLGHVMPTSSALNLASAIHKAAPHLPILLAIASAEEVRAEALMTAGITEVVSWPFVSSEVAAALARCLVEPRSDVALPS